ncbi:hypothetical protein V8E36_003391 [Tilletia maclaganii]
MSESESPMGSDATHDDIAAQAAADAAAILAAAGATGNTGSSSPPSSPSHKKKKKKKDKAKAKSGNGKGNGKGNGNGNGKGKKGDKSEDGTAKIKRWRLPEDRVLLQTLLELKVNENMPAGNFKIKVTYAQFRRIVQRSGFSWCNESYTIQASDDRWDQLIEEDAAHASLQNKRFDLYETMDSIVEGNIAVGDNAMDLGSSAHLEQEKEEDERKKAKADKKALAQAKRKAKAKKRREAGSGDESSDGESSEDSNEDSDSEEDQDEDEDSPDGAGVKSDVSSSRIDYKSGLCLYYMAHALVADCRSGGGTKRKKAEHLGKPKPKRNRRTQSGDFSKRASGFQDLVDSLKSEGSALNAEDGELQRAIKFFNTNDRGGFEPSDRLKVLTLFSKKPRTPVTYMALSDDDDKDTRVEWLRTMIAPE